MPSLKEMIIEQGEVYPGNILNVDSFLNHQIDPDIIKSISDEFYAHYKDMAVNKVLTIESSGIAPALMVAYRLGVPMLFAKKALPSSIKSEDKYETMIHSYTKDVTSKVIISKKYLDSNDRVLIIDDFLANGEAAFGLTDLIKQSGATTAGIGICIEKSFQPGRTKLETAGFEVYSICRIKSLENAKIEFLDK